MVRETSNSIYPIIRNDLNDHSGQSFIRGDLFLSAGELIASTENVKQ